MLSIVEYIIINAIKTNCLINFSYAVYVVVPVKTTNGSFYPTHAYYPQNIFIFIINNHAIMTNMHVYGVLKAHEGHNMLTPKVITFVPV